MKVNRKLCILSMVLSICVVTLSFSLSRAEFPEKPINLISGWTPGGSVDSSVRALSKTAEKSLGQAIAVINKPGAAGVIGLGALASASPDGYTIGTNTFTSLTYASQLQDVPFEPLKDFDHLLGYCKVLFGTFVLSDSPFKTIKDLTAYAKANPKTVKYGTVGIGSANNFGMANLAKVEGLDWTPVIFKGGPEVLMAVLGGHVHAGSTTTTELVPYIKAGKMRLLVSMADVRWPMIPEVPAIRELGYGFHISEIYGLSAPKGVPKPILSKLREAFKKAMSDPEFLQMMDNIQLKPYYLTPEEYQKAAEESYKENTKVFMDLGIHKSQKK